MNNKTLKLNADEALRYVYIILGGENPYFPGFSLRNQAGGVIANGLTSEKLSIPAKIELRGFAKKLDEIIAPVLAQANEDFKKQDEEKKKDLGTIFHEYGIESEKKEITFTKLPLQLFEKVESEFDYSTYIEALCLD